MAGFMDHPEGAGAKRGDRVDFDRRVRLEFQGTQLIPDGGLLVVRERWMMRSVCPIPELVPCAMAVWARTPSTGSTACFGSRSMGGPQATRMSTMRTGSPVIRSCGRLWVGAPSMHGRPPRRKWGGSRPIRWLCPGTERALAIFTHGRFNGSQRRCRLRVPREHGFGLLPLRRAEVVCPR